MRAILTRLRTLPPLAQNLLLSLATVLACLSAAEGLARLFEHDRPSAAPTAGAITRWTDGEAEFYTIKSTATGWPPWEDYNSEGVRDREHELRKPAGVRRVACLGDSVTLGTGLAAADAWPQLLQDRLDAMGVPAEVLNVALGGWATRQERIAYARIARKYRPDLVLLGVCLNDIPELHNNLARPPRLLGALYLRSALVRWAVGARRREIRQIDELFERRDAPQVQAAFARFFAEVDALAREVHGDGAAFALVVFPYRGQMEPGGPAPTVQEEIAAHGRAQGLAVVDLRPALLDLGPAAFTDDVHLTAPASERVAEAVAGSSALAPVMVAAGVAPAGAESASSVPVLASRLADRDPRVRAASAWALGGYREQAASAAAALSAALEDDDARARAGACWALGRIGPAAGAAAARALVARLDDPDATVRRRAGEALVSVGARCPGCVPLLTAKVAEPAGTARAAAATAMGALGATAWPATPVLAAALQDPRPDVRARAAWAIGRIGPAAASAVPALLALSEDPAVGWSAVDALGGIGPPAAAAAPRLARALRDASGSRRWRAAQALGRMGAAVRAYAGSLVPAMADEEANVRLAAADALARVEADPALALPALGAALHDPDARVRAAAAHGLGRMGAPARGRTLDLLATLHDADATVRAAAARALHQVGASVQARSALAGLAAHDPDDGVRAAARRALRSDARAER